MKKIFFAAALVAMSFASCTNDEAGSAISAGGAGKKAYLKVDLKAAGSFNKADVGSYVDGTAAENAISTVKFYFYDANGNAYTVGTNPVNANSISFNPEATFASIEEVSDVVLVIKQSQVAPPAKVIAVINENESEKIAGKSLSEVASTLVSSLTDGTNFTMSNSVYVNGDDVVVNAVEILPEHIFTTNDKELENVEVGTTFDPESISTIKHAQIKPIEIYVERVAAKVEVKLENDGLYDTGVTFDAKNTDSDSLAANVQPVKIYAQVLGWNVTNNTSKANVIKAIDPSWTGLGFTPWNNAAFCRSYWAKMDASVTPVHGYTFENLIGANMTNGYQYYFENTLQPAATRGNSVVAGEGDQNPQLLVAAQLVTVDKDGKTSPIALGKWYGVTYTLDGLKTAMVNTIASKLFVFDELNSEVDVTMSTDENIVYSKKAYKSVTVDDVDFVQASATEPDNRYEVSMVAKSGVEYYTPASIKNGNSVATADVVNAIFDGVEVAQMWLTGYTYYYTDINHFGTAKGMVRNHCYEITIDAITELGTPVYDPKKIITPEPVDPQDALNLAAKINILSWSLVQQNVTLK